MDLRLEQFAHTNVKIVPDTMSLLTDTELTQYYIQAWTLDYNHPGTVFRYLNLKKRYKRQKL